MNKEWFIFKGSHHLGPFSLQEMDELFRSGEITAQTLVWKEGAEKWETMSRTVEMDSIVHPAAKAPPQAAALPDLPLVTEEDLPPPAPPTFLGSKEKQEKQEKQVRQVEQEELPPPVPLDALLKSSGAKTMTPSASIKEQAPWKKRAWRVLLYIAALVLLLAVGWFFQQQLSTRTSIKIKGIMPVYLERLQETAELTTPSFMLTMALSLDGKTLWATTNKGGDIQSVIKLQSMPKRILGKESVALTVRGMISDHLGKFNKMQMTEGKQFVPGEYRYEFNGKKTHFLNRHFSFLASIPLFKKLNTTYRFSGEALIYAGTPREFEKKLIDYRQGMLDESLRPFHDKLERMQTFSSLLNKTAEKYLLVLEKIKTGKEIKEFEQIYLREISQMIMTLVTEAHDLSQDKKFQEADFRNPIAPYKEQINLGKQIGELASDMITETGKYKKLSDKDKSQLRFKFENRYRNVKLQIEINVKKIEGEIAKLSQ